MKVKFITAFDNSAEQDRLGQTLDIVFMPFNVLKAEFVPGTISFSLIIVISGLETNKLYECSLKIYHEETEDEIFKEGFSLKTDEDTLNTNLSLKLRNSIINYDGVYKIELKIGENIECDEFKVIANKKLRFADSDSDGKQNKN